MTTLFETCKTNNIDLWHRYVKHPFVQGIQDGTLSPDVFRAYLVQDYHYLLTYVRGFFLAASLAPNLKHMEFCATQGQCSLNEELLNNHTSYFAHHGITLAEVTNTPIHPKARGYIDYLQSVMNTHNYPRLLFALSSCFVGYVEIGERLQNSPDTNRTDNPYLDWINLYGGDIMQQGASKYLTMMADCETFMDGADRTAILDSFVKACIHEANFWEAGYTL